MKSKLLRKGCQGGTDEVKSQKTEEKEKGREQTRRSESGRGRRRLKVQQLTMRRRGFEMRRGLNLELQQVSKMMAKAVSREEAG